MRQAFAGLAALILVSTAAAQNAPRTIPQLPLQEAGTLTCTFGAGIGLVLGSTRTATCIFDHPGPFFFSETYAARLSRVGIDLGVTSKQAIKWTVYTPGGQADPGLLGGVHVGASAEAAVIFGSGAQAIFASKKGAPIMLQQLSSTTPLGLAFGLGQISLDLVATSDIAVPPPSH